MAETRAVIHWMDWGLWRQSNLSARLGVPISITGGFLRPRESSAYIGWGLKTSGKRARTLASKHGCACWLLEDGFLRSLGGGRDSSWSLVVDDLGIYYDASGPSRLEHLISQPLDARATSRIKQLLTFWRQERLSKYNAARDPDPRSIPKRYVLVVDQTAGDAAIAAGHSSPKSFRTMLSDALENHPDCIVVVKLHPEVVSGVKQGHFDLTALLSNPRIQLVADESHPALWIANAVAVYTVTSQLGFEALLWAKPVYVYGMPFYAGWGLTMDKLPRPARRKSVSLEQLAHSALIDYPRYFDPETGKACEVETLMEWLALQRRQRQRFAPEVTAFGFSKWKQEFLRDFLAGSNVVLADQIAPYHPHSGPLITWGHKHADKLEKNGYGDNTTLRVEDGFLRSVGLGAELIRPLSWVIDPIGIYYDASRPSLLEEYLETWHFDDTLRARARTLRELIVNAGLTKYNLRRADRWHRPAHARHVILVIGQVETDASICYGANSIRHNIGLLQAVRREHPHAWLLYKPHPDVLAGLRNQGQDEAQALRWCNELVTAPYETLLQDIDEVHVLTSLAGFEALMRGVPVTTWGQPFYAGWGLTLDRGLSTEVSSRRNRRLDLDELVAATLILYPTYVSRIARRFCSPERAVSELLAWREERSPTLPFRRLIAKLSRKP